MALWLLAGQLAIGGALVGMAWRVSGRSRARQRTEGSGVLLRAAPIAAAVAVAVEIVARAIGAPSPAVATVGEAALHGRWLYAVGGLLTVPGCFLIVHAGWIESRGQVDRARREARRAGFLAAGGALGQATSVTATLALSGFTAPGATPLSASLTTVLAAGCAGLLAGLAGKPRPGGYLASALVVLSAVAWLAAR